MGKYKSRISSLCNFLQLPNGYEHFLQHLFSDTHSLCSFPLSETKLHTHTTLQVKVLIGIIHESAFSENSSLVFWAWLGCGMWCHIVWWSFTDVSEENLLHSSWLESKRSKSQQTKASCLLDLLIDPKDACRTFLWSVCKLAPDYTVSYPRRQKCREPHVQHELRNCIKLTC
jgi:hypothetical protein